jgi:stage II sporulation protein D
MQVQQPGSVSLQPFQGPIVLQDIGGASAAQPSLFCYNGVQYRGSLVIRSLNNNLLVLNVLNMESYLYGVVGEEMGGGASAEAYCAQAVASRSYALSMRGNSPWYDVGSGTGAQAYGGYTAEQEFACNGDNPVVDAVQRTSGQVLEYAGALVTAYFHANAGGYTEDMENVWAGSRPYLKGVQSDGDAYADKLGGGAQSDYTWTKTCDRSDLGTQLGVGRVLDIQVSRNRTQVSTDPVSGRVTMNLVPGTTTVSGRVTQVTVVGTDGTKTYYRDAIRQALGLKSTLFDVSMGGQLEALDSQGQNDALSGSEVTALGKDGTPQSVPLRTGSLYVIGSGSRLVAQGASTDEITFSGRGYGHGVGMSQVGAIGMAVEGYKYMDILELYYDQGKQDGNLQIVGNYGN